MADKIMVKEWGIHKEDLPLEHVRICAMDEDGNPLFRIECHNRDKMKRLMVALHDCVVDAWTGGDD